MKAAETERFPAAFFVKCKKKGNFAAVISIGIN
jgi:hypothetical protein